MKIQLLASVAVAAILTFAPAVMAQDAADFPGGKPITMIIPFAPGGSVDTGFRLLVPGLEKQLGTSIEVQNVDGGGGQVGITDFVRTAKPDGYTIVNLGLPTVLTQYADPARGAIYSRDSFIPLAQTWSGSYGIGVMADSPIQTLDQLFEMAKAEPDTITVGDSGLMAAPHLMLEMLERQAGVDFASVHLQGGSAATAALLGGHVQAMAGGAGDFAPLLANKSVRMLAVATDGPRDTLPGVKTFTEQGVPFLFETRQTLAVPAGTPDAIVKKLEGAIQAALSDPEVLASFSGYGNVPAFVSGAALSEEWTRLETQLVPVVTDLLKQAGN